MPLKISKVIVGHTLAEIIEIYYPEQWEKAQDQLTRLVALQKFVISRFPHSKEQLPENIDQLEDATMQQHLQNYILLSSLYCFAEKVSKIRDSQCSELAKNQGKEYDEDNACKLLEQTLEILVDAHLEELIHDQQTGLHQLSKVTYKFERRLDFLVFEQCSFHDIMGTINHDELKNESIFQSVIHDVPPISISISKLLDDDTMHRVY